MIVGATGRSSATGLANAGPQGSAARLVAPVLRVPLLLKLLGANLLIVAAAFAEQFLFPGSSALARSLSILVLSFGATALLVWLALRPISLLEATADKVSAGDFGARVKLSSVADNAVMQLSVTMNKLLDRVEADRARIQYLAGRSVRARDIERESVARELRDSLAQMVTGIALQISAVRRGKLDSDTDLQLESTRRLVDELNDQMRGEAEPLYPGTISEFGLANALRALGRIFARRSTITIAVDADSFEVPLSPAVSGALYRVAEEALRNVTQHSHAMHATMTLASNEDGVKLELEDDGRGIDIKTHDVLRAGLGLFSAQTVLALAGGELQVSGAPGKGTRVTARIPHKSLGQGSWRTTS